LRYVPTIDENIADLQEVTLDEVRNFHAQFYGASHAEFVVNSQFDVPEIQKLAADLLGNWKSPSNYSRIHDPYSKVPAADQKIETPDKQNAVWSAGLNFPMNDEDPDYPAMLIANFIFGGSSNSRLFNRIRNKEGLSYGVRSGFGAPTLD